MLEFPRTAEIVPFFVQLFSVGKDILRILAASFLVRSLPFLFVKDSGSSSFIADLIMELNSSGETDMKILLSIVLKLTMQRFRKYEGCSPSEGATERATNF